MFGFIKLVFLSKTKQLSRQQLKWDFCELVLEEIKPMRIKPHMECPSLGAWELVRAGHFDGQEPEEEHHPWAAAVG